MVYLKENKLQFTTYSTVIKMLLLWNKTISVFIEGFFLPHGHAQWLIMRRQNYSLQSSLPIKLNRKSNFGSLVNFEFVSSTCQISEKRYLMFFILSCYHFKIWKRTKLTLLCPEKNINIAQITTKFIVRT